MTTPTSAITIECVPYTYILRCADGSYYVGSTFNVERRVWQHGTDTEGAVYTRTRRPVELAWAGWFDSIREAYYFEKQVQGWSRAKREALIDGRYADLPELAASGDREEWIRQRRLPVGSSPPTTRTD